MLSNFHQCFVSFALHFNYIIVKLQNQLIFDSVIIFVVGALVVDDDVFCVISASDDRLA